MEIYSGHKLWVLQFKIQDSNVYWQHAEGQAPIRTTRQACFSRSKLAFFTYLSSTLMSIRAKKKAHSSPAGTMTKIKRECSLLSIRFQRLEKHWDSNIYQNIEMQRALRKYHDLETIKCTLNHDYRI